MLPAQIHFSIRCLLAFLRYHLPRFGDLEAVEDFLAIGKDVNQVTCYLFLCYTKLSLSMVQSCVRYLGFELGNAFQRNAG